MRINLRLMQNVLVVACLLTPLSSPGQDSAAEKRLISIDDQASFRSIGSPVFSADGQWLAYTVTTGDYEKNQSLNRIWMQPAQGGSLVALTAAGVSSWSPVFSKDGRTLYFHAMFADDPEALRRDLKAGMERRVREALE